MSHTYCLRSVREDMTSKNGFVWPVSGMVTCPDWKDTQKCGNGLHGLMLGQNDPGEWYRVAMVVKVETAKIVDLGGKCKFPECEVVYVGDMAGATSFFVENGGAEGLYRRTQIGGYGSTLTGGDGSTLTGGYGSEIVCKWHDGTRKQSKVHYVGENGIKPNTPYKNESGELVEVAV